VREKPPSRLADSIDVTGATGSAPAAPAGGARRGPSTRLARWLVSGPPLAYLLVFFAIPSLIMVVASFRFPGDFGGLAPLLYRDEDGTHFDVTLESYTRFFSDVLYLQLFLKSFWYAALTTLLCLVIAYPLAMLIARSPKKQRDLLVLLVILPFWSNFLIRVYAWMIILGPNSVFVGALNRLIGVFGFEPLTLLYTPFAVIVGLVYVHLPFMVLPLYANREKHNPALLDAAQDLGANAWNRFWRVTFPLSLPGVFAGAALVFIPAFGIFAIPDILGGTGGIMIGNVIKQQFLDTRDWPFGSVLSIMLTVMAIALAGLAALLARRSRL
jgi:spermidine/putrescine transport system permease protein